jgi:ribosomal-protein-serine acetyltransferase
MFSLTVDDELELVFPTEDSLEDGYLAIMANYDHIWPWSQWLNEDFSLDKVREFYRRNVQKFESGEQIHLRIMFKGEIVGGIDLFEINSHHRSAEIGYWLAKDHTGRGHAIRSVTRLLEHAFDELKLNRIVIKCIPENLKSRAIPEKLGFAREGIERQGGWMHTRFVDHVVYSLLADEWRQALKNKGPASK